MQEFLFVDLAGLTPGKPFAGFAAGQFVDMHGNEVEFKPTTLKTFLANTLKAIADAKGKGMPGLPVDARQHDKGDAAGWIVDASEGEVADSDGNGVKVIMLAAEWTKLGLELLQEKILANFSPTVDLRRKVIRGGSLTNWPASVDGNGVPLFPAVELAEGMYRLQQPESIDDRVERVRRTFYRQHEPASESWVIEVFEEYVIAHVGSKEYRIAYTDDGEDVDFAPRDEWDEVEQAWIEAQIGRKLTEAELGKPAGDKPAETVVNPPAPPSAGQDIQSEVIEMNLTKEELTELIGAQVKAALTGELQQLIPAKGAPPAGGDDKPEFDVLQFLEMSDATDNVVEAFRQQMLDQYELMKQRGAQEAAELIARIKHDNDVAEFSQSVTGGSPDVPYGLPVGIDDLKEFLGRLQPVDYEFAKKLLGDIQRHGRNKFTELGHGKFGRGTAKLEASLASLLKDHIARGGTAEEWFVMAGIGDAADYDLSQFEKEK